MANEKRLIDANILIKRLEAMAHYTDAITIGGIICALKEPPTVDAVEVVHGRWINPYMNRYGHPCHCCSVCGFKASYQDKNYCPNCGAKMDGDGNG